MAQFRIFDTSWVLREIWPVQIMDLAENVELPERKTPTYISDTQQATYLPTKPDENKCVLLNPPQLF